jgi:hypothetical protein
MAAPDSQELVSKRVKAVPIQLRFSDGEERRRRRKKN